MTAYQKGSDEAFERLYEKISPMVYGFVKKHLRDAEADEFYRKVWRHLHEHRSAYDGRPFLPWFFAILDQRMDEKFRSLGRKTEREGHNPNTASIESPSHDLDFEVKKDIQLSFRANVIRGKFIGYLLLGSFFSLTFCHQFDIGIYKAVDIERYFEGLGAWGSGLLSGWVFVTSGALVTYLGLKGEEIWWIWGRYRLYSCLLPIVLWGMFFLVGESKAPEFHLFWIFGGMFAMAMFIGGRSRFWSEFQSH
ncbi:MAG: RNA polymerase sigma factor [Bacteriovoracaceae bacterium]